MNGLVLSLHVGGSGSIVGSGPLTPPTVAPVLTADVASTSYTVNLEWTASNKTDSEGFSYAVETSRDGVSFNRDASTNSLFFDYTVSVGDEGSWYFRIVPFNNAGDGPSSNTATAFIPGT